MTGEGGGGGVPKRSWLTASNGSSRPTRPMAGRFRVLECTENNWPQWHYSEIANATTPTRFVAAAKRAHQALFRHQGRVAFRSEKCPHTLIEDALLAPFGHPPIPRRSLQVAGSAHQGPYSQKARTLESLVRASSRQS